MVRIAIIAATYDAIASTPPVDAPLWPVQRQGGQFLICVEGGPLSTVCGACAGPGERSGDIILGGRQIKRGAT